MNLVRLRLLCQYSTVDIGSADCIPDELSLLREANRHHARARKFVFFHISEVGHWTLFTHKVDDGSITCYQSLTTQVTIDVWSQTVVVQFLTSRPCSLPVRGVHLCYDWR